MRSAGAEGSQRTIAQQLRHAEGVVAKASWALLCSELIATQEPENRRGVLEERTQAAGNRDHARQRWKNAKCGRVGKVHLAKGAA